MRTLKRIWNWLQILDKLLSLHLISAFLLFFLLFLFIRLFVRVLCVYVCVAKKKKEMFRMDENVHTFFIHECVYWKRDYASFFCCSLATYFIQWWWWWWNWMFLKRIFLRVFFFLFVERRTVIFTVWMIFNGLFAFSYSFARFTRSKKRKKNKTQINIMNFLVHDGVSAFVIKWIWFFVPHFAIRFIIRTHEVKSDRKKKTPWKTI